MCLAMINTVEGPNQPIHGPQNDVRLQRFQAYQGESYYGLI